MKLAKVLYLVGGILLSLLGLVMVAIEFRTLAAGDWLLDNNQFFAFFALLGKVLLFGLSLATGVLAIISAFTKEKRAVLLALFAGFGGIGTAFGRAPLLWVIPVVFVVGNILVLVGAVLYFGKNA
jgi:hypothetical protein